MFFGEFCECNQRVITPEDIKKRGVCRAHHNDLEGVYYSKKPKWSLRVHIENLFSSQEEEFSEVIQKYMESNTTRRQKNFLIKEINNCFQEFVQQKWQLQNDVWRGGVSGSYAIGTNQPGSDVDIVLLCLPQFDENIFFEEFFEHMQRIIAPEAVRKTQDFIVHIITIIKNDHELDLIACFLEGIYYSEDLKNILNILPKFKDEKSYNAFKALKTNSALETLFVPRIFCSFKRNAVCQNMG